MSNFITCKNHDINIETCLNFLLFTAIFLMNLPKHLRKHEIYEKLTIAVPWIKVKTWVFRICTYQELNSFCYHHYKFPMDFLRLECSVIQNEIGEGTQQSHNHCIV